jgi:hypothetical protein
MTTPLGIVEDGTEFVRLALDYLCEGLYEVENAVPGVDGINRAPFDASDLMRLGALPPDVDGHPC